MKSPVLWCVVLSLAALVLVGLSLAVAQELNKETGAYTTSAGKVCPRAGTAKSTAGKALNRLKNRFLLPGDSDINADVTLAALLAPGEDSTRFDSSEAAKLVGFVINVKTGGKETCNCDAAAPADKDAHIELGLHKDAPPTQRVIVEITPRMRLLMKQKEIDWSTDTLGKTTGDGIKGKWVEVTGWLMFDTIHADEAENTNPGNSTNWRATCWELHPVTSLKVLDAPPTTTVEVNPAILGAFHTANARQAKQDPMRQAAIQANLKNLLKGFDEDDLKEKEEEAKDRNKGG
jgi:hypothetical protein